MPTDTALLRQAVQLAHDNRAQGGRPFGAVLARGGEVIATGVNEIVHSHDPSAHAEMQALRAAARALARPSLAGCAIYASGHPCPMCLAAAYWAHIERIVYANPREAAAAIGFSDAQLYQQLTLPPAARSLQMEHLQIAGAEEPLKAWRESLGRVGY